RSSFFLMNRWKNQSRRVQHDTDILNSVVLKIIASGKIHILMQSIQRRNQVFSASYTVIRFADCHIQKKLLEKRLLLRCDCSAGLFLNILLTLRKDFCLERIPYFLQISPDLPEKHLLLIDPHADISGCRMYLA